VGCQSGASNKASSDESHIFDDSNLFTSSPYRHYSTMITYRGRALIAWCVVFTFLDLASLAARFYTIRLQRRALRIDDYLVVVAVAAMLALVGCAAWGKHSSVDY
jgi:hypothetical protein